MTTRAGGQEGSSREQNKETADQSSSTYLDDYTTWWQFYVCANPLVLGEDPRTKPRDERVQCAWQAKTGRGLMGCDWHAWEGRGEERPGTTGMGCAKCLAVDSTSAVGGIETMVSQPSRVPRFERAVGSG
ncbi:hypothetical protein NPX13_g7902 [Xylaria arbuscula]|uniref:Uncharacterized protein n=1 Tax=Xylaria arbuscula TaxID=114810 RepID=A0A9W8N9G4_9PEZI|nr:hypothetical protein NPX13_g7902 [Xylaria arbuscula]